MLIQSLGLSLAPDRAAGLRCAQFVFEGGVSNAVEALLVVVLGSNG